MPVPLSPDLRARIICAWKAGATYDECAAQFLVSRSTVDRLIHRFRQTGDIEPKPHGGGHPRALPSQIAHVLVELVEVAPDATRDELRHALKATLGIELSVTAIGRELRRLKLSLKKKTVRATEGETPKNKAARRRFCQEVRQIEPERLICVDETGSHIAMTRSQAWAPVGKRAIDITPRNRGRVLTLLGALSIDGFEAFRAVEGGTSAQVFREFISSNLVPKLKPGDVVIMDRLGAHRATGVRELIEACGARIKFQPPYSPMLNPVEHAWSKVKGILRELEARDKAALREAARRAAKQITPADAIGWFKHCGILRV